MKLFTKTLLASGLLAAASAQAANVNINIDNDAVTGASNFASSLFSVEASEDFNNLPALGGLTDFDVDDGTDQGSWEARSENRYIDTRVGKFTSILKGQDSGNPYNEQLMIESYDTGEFGREKLSLDYQDELADPEADPELEEPSRPDDFWLDSNDAQSVRWDFTKPAGGSFNAIGFYMADAADQGATLSLVLADGGNQFIDMSKLFPNQGDGNLKFVSITSDVNIQGGKLFFANSNDRDGFGIDNVTLGKLPEPGTLLLMGLGLLGLGAARRRAAK